MSEEGTKFTVGDGEADRIDRVITRRFPNTSRRKVTELFDTGAVRIDGTRAKKGDRAAVGAVVTLTSVPSSPEDMRVVADPEVAARLTVLHLDDDVIMIAKPPGMPSQPLRAGELGTVANGIVSLHPECANVADDPRDGGLVHRLDGGTSGVLAAARSRGAWQQLRTAFAAHQVGKSYLALVDAPPVSRGCEAPLVQRGGKVVVDHTGGLDAQTSWEVVRTIGERVLLRCTATTGRMHQVRVHLATCGAPIAGDTLYGGQPLPELVGFFLHAERLTLPGQPTVEAPLPPDRVAALAALEG